MARVIFISPDGDKTEIEAECGSVMELAVEHDIEGIDGSCGGVCSCATCHVKVGREWLARTGPATDTEKDILSFEDNVDERSRLCCQIELTDELDGLVVETIAR
ncbi:2Fe-2S iron-sulfur cluster-binding protein [Luteolibacter algae]|uniref:2Fe-2S iron-sulfur cluster-binding protein n=1 Tax=Luteolibacter algae TaxID=454151 RepID=A0ABW5DAZ8_9BACT